MRRAWSVLAPVAVGLTVAACGATAPQSLGPTANVIVVRSTADECSLSSSTAPAGPTAFRVTRGPGEPSTVSVYAADGQRVVAEVDGVRPTQTGDLTVVLRAGTYTVGCRPGQIGEVGRASLSVTGATTAATGDLVELSNAAAAYSTWVEAQVSRLHSGTTEFVAAIRAGDIAAAKALYAPTRANWERIEPAAASFLDLTRRLDGRENEVEDLAAWTGWHRLEKALFHDGSLDGMVPVAEQLLTDTQDLAAGIATTHPTIDQVTNNAKELVEEVAAGEISGEEERYSHTDLSDFQANVEGARAAWNVVSTIVAARDPNLTKAIELGFVDLQKTFDTYRRGSEFMPYDALSEVQLRDLAVRVEGLSEPLSRLTATVFS
jgi:iron uptake system component EfeO